MQRFNTTRSRMMCSHIKSLARGRRASHRGVFLIEIVLALVVLGMIAAAVFPMLDLASRKEADMSDRAVLAQARDALVAYAVRNGGFPGPLVLKTESSAAGSTFSRTALADESATGAPAVALASSAPYGALPAHLLGTPRTSSKGTFFNFDVHPALRADQAFNLDGLTLATQGLSSLHAMDRNSQGTGGSASQLCRNLNTLIDMERRVQLAESAYYSVNLPRMWQTGSAGSLAWTAGLFRPPIAVAESWVTARSSPAAFMLTRPHALAQARLDRANAVFAADVIPATLSSVSSVAGYRIYEHPATSAFDSASDDLRDYGGWSNGATLMDLRSGLQAAGQCTRSADSCMNTEIQLTVDNALKGEFYTDTTPSGNVIGLPLYWAVAPVSAASAAPSVSKPASDPSTKNGTLSNGYSSASCVPLLYSANFTSLPPMRVDVYTLLPGTGYWPLTSVALTATLTTAILHSGNVAAATLKCSTSTPVKLEGTVSNASVQTSGAGGVSCSLLND